MGIGKRRYQNTFATCYRMRSMIHMSSCSSINIDLEEYAGFCKTSSVLVGFSIFTLEPEISQQCVKNSAAFYKSHIRIRISPE